MEIIKKGLFVREHKDGDKTYIAYFKTKYKGDTYTNLIVKSSSGGYYYQCIDPEDYHVFDSEFDARNQLNGVIYRMELAEKIRISREVISSYDKEIS